MATPRYSIGRMSDRTYYMQVDQGSFSKFHVKDPEFRGESAYYIADKAIRLYQERYINNDKNTFETIRFSYGGRKWKVVRSEESKWYSFLLKFFKIILFHKPAKSTPTEFKIERAWFAPKDKEKIPKEVKKACNESISGRLKRANFHSFQRFASVIDFGLTEVSPLEYAKGVRRKIQDDSAHSPYDDPFTRLATLANERLETRFNSKDYGKPKDCRYRIIQEGESLLLVKRKSAYATLENKRQAVDSYLTHLRQYWGSEKIDYINHQYKLKLEEIQELTPELIFRINCGTANLEIQEIRAVLEKLKNLAPSPYDGEIPFETYAGNTIPRFYLQNIIKLIKKDIDETPLVKDFLAFMEGMPAEIEKVSPESFNYWLQIFRPSLEAQEKCYTGKKIVNVIQGAYQSGEYQKFKPWIDQQELSQTFQDLIDSTSFESYLERLSHVVVKKHLARRHPSENIRIGALIPAPPLEPGGQVRWYRVSSCATNQYSYSYTLESVCNDPTLPVIKVCRNTASSAYALYSSKSILNDLSVLNPPGYMGINLFSEEERAFFKERSIPLWVACQDLARQKLTSSQSQEEAFALMLRANEALARSLQRAHKPLSFREVLKKHDVILNELYFRNEYIYDFKGKNLSPKFLSLFKNILKQHIRVSEEESKEIPVEATKKSAKRLFRMLNRLLKANDDPRENALIGLLKEDLSLHILDEAAQTAWANANLRKDQDVMAPFESFASIYSAMDNAEEKLNLLYSWSSKMEEYAKQVHEDLSAKRSESIVFAGHSLGGAFAQVLLTHYFSNEERMPLPGQNCRLAEFDAPAINAEDNSRFVNFGNTNWDVFRTLNSGFSVFRRQEVGDIVPGVGEEHLGAVFDEETAAKLAAWLKFDAGINKRLKTANRKEIALAETVHDTIFLEGKKVQGTIEINSKKIKKIKPDQEQGDFLELTYDPIVQGIFNSHGKKGEFKKEKGEKIYNKLYRRIWKFPRYKLFTESFRKSTSYLTLSVKRLLLSHRGKDRTFPREVQDLYGSVYLKN